ncbi:tetratricopeptide repeat protein [Dokdonella sp.]|uniref:O-linked N-acetylglucosamine transferase, SPINDLY family protein n=1 Tax=Dokdonella sp. TaxID=2291710 RepID=UPI003529A45F
MSKAIRLHKAGELEAAKNLYASILGFQPRNPDALHLYGLACHQLGDHATAVAYIRQAVDLVPDQPVLRNNLGDALHKSGDLAAAAEHLREALALRPDYAGAHMNLGSVLADSGDHDAALEHTRESTRLDPGRAEAWFNLGMQLLDHVELEESIASFRRALALRAAYPAAANSLLYVLNLLPDADPVEVADEHRRVASDLFGNAEIRSNRADRSEKIRIGYVSGDFCAHAVNYFFEPILEHHDRTKFEIYCYSDVARPDRVTQRLQSHADHWREISGASDDDVAKLIRSDRIDVLFDLAGYTEHGRLAVFSRKPAPVQVSCLGYPNTTGLGAMDYRIVDQFTAPADEAMPGTESLLRLPDAFACFRPPGHAPDVRAAPLEKNGFVTFGSLHKLEKLNATVVEAWAKILLQNPTARLLIARDQLDAWHQRRLHERFTALDVGPERIEMVHLSDPAQSFFDVFSRIDVLLDVFPWSGHTIACCALWMGVPVVTLRGNSHAGRMVGSVLAGLGLNEWIAADVDAYIRMAGDIGRDPARISELRASLRNRMEASPLRDEAGFTRGLESKLVSLLGHGFASSI